LKQRARAMPHSRGTRKVGPMRRIVLLAAFLSLRSLSFVQQPAPAKATTGPSEFKIGGAVTTPMTVTLEDLKKMPRKTLHVENAHAKRTEVYEGVPLEALLQKAGVPQGEQVRGAAMATYVLVEAADDYHVVFSLAELDSSFLDSEVLVADTMDGAPLTPDQGPFKLVAPHEKRPARSVKMVKSITVGRASN
jgi:DMSO/TMAO reductase YedYZ molybdopterin-dependent catalytic subunit